MSSKFDLHSHSTASDGLCTPETLVARAAAAGLQVLALTDHDTIDGLASAQVAAAREGLILIPGVEISVTWQGATIHVVGLNIDPQNPELLAGLESILAFRRWRALEIGRRLAACGIPGAFEGARALATGALVGRTHFARFLVAAGQAADVASVFKHYLVKGKPGHVHGEWAKLEQAVAWIRAAGGEAVLAHPARYKLTHTKLRLLLRHFIDFGGRGIEVVSGSQSQEEGYRLAGLAIKLGLCASLGSDYHGEDFSRIELGRLPPLPSGCRPLWSDWPVAQTLSASAPTD